MTIHRSFALALIPILLFGFAGSAASAKFRIRHVFGDGADGGDPKAGLLRKGTNFFGTTWSGGAYGNGTVFKIKPNGAEAVLYSFAGGADGGNPACALLVDNAGNLYGTTYYGGAYGFGTVFKLAPDGTETVLHSFADSPNDGAHPAIGLTRDRKGNFYGTTIYGGLGAGTIFKLARDGTETVLHSFAGGGDGANPSSLLTRDDAGNLYGTTLYGGGANAGVVFEVSPGGGETVLYSFMHGSDGGRPNSGLVMDEAGNLYGAAANGGIADNGLIYKLAPDGAQSVLYSFTGGSDGAHPATDLFKGASGDFYGTTGGGGAYGSGTIFELTYDGSESVLYDFNPAKEGPPESNLIPGSAGTFWGTTSLNGPVGSGTVFQFKP